MKTTRPSDTKLAATVEKRVASPCVSLCALDLDDVCVGCHRSAREISDWVLMGDDERREVLLRSVERNRQKNPFL